MSNKVFDDTMQGLQEALAYAKGEIELRTFTVTVDDEEIERNHTFIQDFYKLPETSKVKAIEYVRELALQA
jgi:sulfatase maturation enzyme AslB (radical SAM superfamily)